MVEIDGFSKVIYFNSTNYRIYKRNVFEVSETVNTYTLIYGLRKDGSII